MRVIDIVKELRNYLNLPADNNTLYKERIGLFLDLVKAELKPMSGLLSSIKEFKNQGLKLAIASSGAKEYINLVIDRFEIRPYFDVVITGDDVSKGKPDPETYNITCKKLQSLPENCIVLEDAEKGVRSAKAAGCLCVGIVNTNTPIQDLHEADVVVNNLTESVKYVKTLMISYHKSI